ncbi:unnamed protein product [Mucor hiemalis]
MVCSGTGKYKDVARDILEEYREQGYATVFARMSFAQNCAENYTPRYYGAIFNVVSRVRGRPVLKSSALCVKD